MIPISVIIPTRNREDVLAECLDRLLAEPVPPFEIIVIDSSSTERTQSILARYPSVVNHRLGDVPFSMVLSRNIGISRARGNVVAFIDDDCFVLPGWLAELAQAFEDPSVAAAGGRVIYHPWKQCGHGSPVAKLDLERDTVWAEWDRTLDAPIDVPHLPGGNCAVRRSVAQAVGGFDTNFIGSANHEETDFFLRVSKTGGRIVFIPSAVVEHRAAPRADGIVRSMANFNYRYSLVRNRLYFMRKHGAAGLPLTLRRQLVDAAVGTGRMLANTATFAAASAAGIVAGLATKPIGKNAGFSQQANENSLPHPSFEEAHEL
jgi:glycosyltransferase involved in cell wall biosynthesis